MDLSSIDYFKDYAIEQIKQGELLNVTQPQFTNKLNNIEFITCKFY